MSIFAKQKMKDEFSAKTKEWMGKTAVVNADAGQA